MSMLEIVDANYLDALALAANIRDDDRREVEATSTDGDVRAAVLSCMRRSVTAYSVRINGDLIGMGGFIPQDNAMLGWFLSTNAVTTHWKYFVRASRNILPSLLSQYSLIYNYVDVRYKKAIRWLIWAGFQDGPVYAMWPHGAHFVKMTWEK